MTGASESRAREKKKGEEGGEREDRPRCRIDRDYASYQDESPQLGVPGP